MFKISGPVDPVSKKTQKNDFFDALAKLPVGKAVLIEGIEQSNAVSKANLFGKMQNPRWRFSSTKLENGTIQLTRKE